MNVIGNHMLDYCSQNDISFDYKRILISTNQAERILLATPLLRWYLKNNSEITKIYQIIEYQPKKCFKNFIDKVTEFRIEGDRNPDKAIGDTYKLLSNSSYGSVLMDKTKHTNVKYLTNKAKMTKIINFPRFKAMEELNHNIFEVETYKSRLTLDIPVLLILPQEGARFSFLRTPLFFLISKDAKKYELSNQILDEIDPFELEILMEDFSKNYQKEDDRERIMRFAILQKFIQNREFREKLKDCSDSYIVYKQSTLSKQDISFWGVTTPSRLVLVLKSSSLSGNNLLGKILMDYSKKVDALI